MTCYGVGSRSRACCCGEVLAQREKQAADLPRLQAAAAEAAAALRSRLGESAETPLEESVRGRLKDCV